MHAGAEATVTRSRAGRRGALPGLLGATLLAAFPAMVLAAAPDHLEDLTASLRPTPDAVTAPAGSAQAEGVRAAWSERGTLRYLGAPPGMAFAPPSGGSSEPEVIARLFIESQRDRFGLAHPGLGLQTFRTRSSGGRRFIRLQETFSGVPIFGAMACVQLDAEGGIEAVIADLSGLDRPLDTRPALPASRAEELARSQVRGADPAKTVEIRPPSLQVWAPSVLGVAGEPRLVWVVEVGVPAGGSARLLLDARDGSVVREYPLEHSALDRQIYDANNTASAFAAIVRDEGDPPCGIADADAAYDQLASTYSFFVTHHSRDSYDGAGGVIRGSVRYCPSQICPWQNASWDGFFGNIKFGEGWTVDDVTGHEFAHGFTDYGSGLIYENASGAMNESFSDIWGEFVDLSDGAGGFDDPSLRWLIGEALPNFTLRDMQDPPAYEDPDRLHSTWFVPPTPTPNLNNDYGGVHTNSGVNNKLCSLLTDGGAFNGETVYGMGIPAVADLYYQVNENLLTPAADWVDLFNALMQAAINLGWSNADRINLRAACNAVEIGIYLVDSGSGCAFQTGVRCSGLTGPFVTVLTGHNTVPAGSTLQIRTGTYPENLTLTNRIRLRAEGGVVRLGQ